jgi:NosR/NirI family nitrous oxide reductase transcriptional regulator
MSAWWALKYIILILLFGLSLQSIVDARELRRGGTVQDGDFHEIPARMALCCLRCGAHRHRRDQPQVLLQVPLPARSAALSIPGRFRLFEWWLRRRKECGKPCQVCAHQCSVRAIRPTGEINANECHYCLDCQVIYYNENMCVPLIDRRKRREQQRTRGRESAANAPATNAATAPETIPVAIIPTGRQ